MELNLNITPKVMLWFVYDFKQIITRAVLPDFGKDSLVPAL